MGHGNGVNVGSAQSVNIV